MGLEDEARRLVHEQSAAERGQQESEKLAAQELEPYWAQELAELLRHHRLQPVPFYRFDERRGGPFGTRERFFYTPAGSGWVVRDWYMEEDIERENYPFALTTNGELRAHPTIHHPYGRKVRGIPDGAWEAGVAFTRRSEPGIRDTAVRAAAAVLRGKVHDGVIEIGPR